MPYTAGKVKSFIVGIYIDIIIHTNGNAYRYTIEIASAISLKFLIAKNSDIFSTQLNLLNLIILKFVLTPIKTYSISGIINKNTTNLHIPI